MSSFKSISKRLRASIEGMNYEIVSPQVGLSDSILRQPAGKEILLLLSGKVHIGIEQSQFKEMPRDRALVLDKPYRVFCPGDSRNGKILIIQNGNIGSSIDSEMTSNMIGSAIGSRLN